MKIVSKIFTISIITMNACSSQNDVKNKKIAGLSRLLHSSSTRKKHY